MKSSSILLCIFLVFACASCASKEQMFEHVYNTVKMRDRMEQDPLDLAQQDQVSYDRYKKEKEASTTTKEPVPSLPATRVQ